MKYKPIFSTFFATNALILGEACVIGLGVSKIVKQFELERA